MIKLGLNVISFGAGEPNFNTPKDIQKVAITAIKRGKTNYTPISEITDKYCISF